MPRFRTILVPLDGSGFAESALNAAATLARRSDAVLHLVRVHEQLPLWDTGAELVVVSPEMEKQILDREAGYLQKVAGRLEQGGLTITTAVLKGEVVPALREYAEDRGVDLVMMTSHGRGGIRRAVLGSVADQLLRSLSIPVLIMTHGMAPSGSPDWPRRILVPLDGSPLAESALDQVEALDPRGASELFLTSVIQTMPPAITPWGFPPELMVETSEQREVQAREALQLMVNESRARGRAAHQRIRIGSKVAKEVLRVADQERCDLIAIASHGAGGIDRAMFGSVADQIVRHSHVPVLVLRPSLRNTAPRLSPVGASSREVL